VGVLLDSPGSTVPAAAQSTAASANPLVRLRSLSSASDDGARRGDGGGWTGWPLVVVAFVVLLALGVRREAHPHRATRLDPRTA